MTRFRNDRRFIAWMLQRNRRKRDAGQSVPLLTWDNPPPSTGSLNSDITATWKGGKAPYRAVCQSSSVILNDQLDPSQSLTVNADGTSEPAGSYVWTITSDDGQTLTATTNIN